MTQQTAIRTELINILAQQAAESAVDMAGTDAQLLASAAAALDFITNLRFEHETDEALIVLTPNEVTNFRHAYSRHLRNLGISIDMALAQSFE